MGSQRNTGSAMGRIVLFGGQGSPTVFSSSAISTAKDDVRQSAAGAILLSRCHAAFLDDYQSLDSYTKDRLGLDISKFYRPDDFMVHGNPYRFHGLMQGTTICLYQLLHYLVEMERSGLDFTSSMENILETTGFCSGLIPATIVACSSTLTEFINAGVEAFRLAFWIGCRTVLESQKQGVPTNEEASWSLVILGLPLSQIQESLEDFHTNMKLRTVRVSAISSATVISLSGPGPDLSNFRQHLASAPMTKFAHVHSWYHGGEQLEDSVRQVLGDLERRGIKFPNIGDLKRPVRSTRDGLIFSCQNSDAQSLAEWVIRHLLIYPVDWVKASRGISESIAEHLKGHKSAETEIWSFGPSTELILAEIKSQTSDLTIRYIDRSSFKVGEHHNSPTSHRDSIAIVGMGVNFPKGRGQKELWETLSNGLNAVSEIPSSRFDVSQFYASDDSQKARTMPVREGAFLDDGWGFDNSFFSISPREAKSMDPQQRIVLSTTQAALEDAGYVGDATPSFQRTSIGCYIGIATGDYVDNLRDDIDVFYSPGTLRAFHSGRISYVYKLSGPCLTIDTACSSSLVSIYQACRALQSGDCTAAIAGGANFMSSPDMFLGLSRGHFLSKAGGCKPFDEAADGYGRAEGCGIFVLKRLADAIAENDHIHGVIRGVEVNQSGNSHSITHPHSETQIKLFQHVLSKSSVDPATISVAECHGTGTQAGDTREMSSIQAVFGKAHSKANPLWVSSIKGNIGHCEAASGAAGLAKLLLMLQMKKIPMQANLSNVNPQFGDLEGAGMIIPRKLLSWDQQRPQPRRALLNNFGAAGSNVALILEEWIESRRAESPELDDRPAYVFNLSAKSKDALSMSIHNYQQHLAKMLPQPRLTDICYTATARRQLYDYRISITCSSIDDLQAKLGGIDLANTQRVQNDNPTVFLFSGQGSLYYGMGMDLMRTSSVFRDLILQADKYIKGLGFPSILHYLCESRQSSPLLGQAEEIIASQCGCVALEYALAKLLISWNIIPDYVVGHSLGEYAALAVSGAITLEDSLYIVANRARMMVDHCMPNVSSMVACKLSPSKADTMLAENKETPQTSVACRNSSDDCVVSGPLEQLETFLAACAKEGVKAKKLDVPYGFHSTSMEPIVRSMKELGKSIKWSTPTIPIASNVLGRLFTQDDFQGDYFACHARQPVRFAEIIQQLSDNRTFDNAVYLEIGPHPTTLPMVRNTLDTPCQFLPTMQKSKDTWTLLGAILGQFFKTCDSVNWRRLFESDAKMIDLPGHPLANTTFTVPYKDRSQITSGSKQNSNADQFIDTGYSLLPRLLKSQSSPDGDSLLFETTMTILGPLISGHNVGGTAICPASVFHELALEAARIAISPPEDQLLVVRNMSFLNPLIYDSTEESKVIRIHLTKVKPIGSDVVTELKIAVNVLQDDQETLCCTTSVSTRTASETKRSLVKDAAMVNRQSRYLLDEHNSHNTFHKNLLYSTIFARVVNYSAEYQSIVKLSLADSNYEGIGSFKLPSNSRINEYVTPPVFTDTLLHAAGFAANLSVRSDEICICGHVESVEILDDVDFSDSFTVYCSLTDMSNNVILADAFALNSSGQAVAVIRGMEFKKLRLFSFQRLLQHARPTTTEVPPTTESSTDTSYSGTPDGLDSDTTLSATPEVVVETRQGIQFTMSRIVGQLYGSQDLDHTQSLDVLGIDSLMQIEIAMKLKEAFPGSGIDQNDLLHCQTLQALEDVLVLKVQQKQQEDITRVSIVASDHKQVVEMKPLQDVTKAMRTNLAKATQKDSRLNPMLLNISDSTNLPVYLVHDGSGQVGMYTRITDPDHTVLAFFDPEFPRQESTFTSLEQMAKRYASELSLSRTPSLIIGGWSFGGVVAFEAARLLSKAGFDVKGLILIDSPYPRGHEPLPEEIIAHVLKSSKSTPNAALLSIATEFEQNAALLGKYEPSDFDDTDHVRIKTVYLRSQDTFDTEGLCGVRYDWLSNQQVRDAAIRAWEPLVGNRIEVLPIPGNHFQPFDPENIAKTSAQLREACRYLESSD